MKRGPQGAANAEGSSFATKCPPGQMAEKLEAEVPRNPERTVALRKLLEAKDAAVRAVIAK